jgi:hypothetical protein
VVDSLLQQFFPGQFFLGEFFLNLFFFQIILLRVVLPGIPDVWKELLRLFREIMSGKTALEEISCEDIL